MSIHENAMRHFRQRLDNELLCVEVPEWGDDGVPAKIYYRQSLSLKEKEKIFKSAQEGSIISIAEALIAMALDEKGNKIYRPVDKTEIMKFYDSEVLSRVVTEMNSDSMTMVDVEKN